MDFPESCRICFWWHGEFVSLIKCKLVHQSWDGVEVTVTDLTQYAPFFDELPFWMILSFQPIVKLITSRSFHCQSFSQMYRKFDLTYCHFSFAFITQAFGLFYVSSLHFWEQTVDGAQFFLAIHFNYKLEEFFQNLNIYSRNSLIFGPSSQNHFLIWPLLTHFKIEMTVNFMNQKKSRIKTANIFIGWSAGALKKLARQRRDSATAFFQLRDKNRSKSATRMRSKSATLERDKPLV